MAADVKAPRIVRPTTNMEDAAAAARARRAPAGNVVDPNLIDNALADIGIARVFLDATDRYFDELRVWVKPGGYMPNAPLHEEVDKGQLIMDEADCRLTKAETRLRTALDQAFNARVGFPTVIDGVRFDTAFAVYRDAFLTANGHWLLNVEADGGLNDADEEVWDGLVDNARDAALNFLVTPAATVADMRLKQEVIDCQEAHCWNGGDIEAFTRQLIADAIALAGGAE